jgi:hypothetical protein
MLDEALRLARSRSADGDDRGRPGRFVIHSRRCLAWRPGPHLCPRQRAGAAQGESGTGKEHIAREIHRLSDYRDGALVAINCGSIPNELFESELFGYVDGAFTSSRRGGRVGLIEQANGGVLYLDEIGEMPLAQQVKLLRVLQERRVRPVGSNAGARAGLQGHRRDERGPADAVESGEFRDDLYYRLNVFPCACRPCAPARGHRGHRRTLPARLRAQLRGVLDPGRLLERLREPLLRPIAGRVTCANCRTSASASWSTSPAARPRRRWTSKRSCPELQRGRGRQDPPRAAQGTGVSRHPPRRWSTSPVTRPP